MWDLFIIAHFSLLSQLYRYICLIYDSLYFTLLIPYLYYRSNSFLIIYIPLWFFYYRSTHFNSILRFSSLLFVHFYLCMLWTLALNNIFQLSLNPFDPFKIALALKLYQFYRSHLHRIHGLYTCSNSLIMQVSLMYSVMRTSLMPSVMQASPCPHLCRHHSGSR